MKPKRIAEAAARLQRRAGGPLDAAIVLGSGLAASATARIRGREIPYEKLNAPITSVPGHPGVAFVGEWAGKRVAAFAGRAHLYEGCDPDAVTYLVCLAAAAGAKTLVLTNAAGALNPAFAAGDVMLIADHINLTGATPSARGGEPFVSMHDAYSPRLRALVRETNAETPLQEGTYAGVRGPHYETPAEAAALRTLGADAVGMSTVLETLAARRLGLEVLGISLIANSLSPTEEVNHERVLVAARNGSDRVARVIEALLHAL